MPLLVALAVAFGHVRPACALDAAMGAPRAKDGAVWVDVRLDDVFAPRVEESLSRGMPATLQFHAELWRRRTGWFDRLESGFDASIRIRYDVWSRTYRLERGGDASQSVDTIDSLRAVLSRPVALPLGRSDALLPGRRYYAVLSVTLKPLSVEDLEEGEGWLSGEVQTKRHAGLSVLTAVPRSVFDAVRNFTGFGDERARVISEDFDGERLAPALRPGTAP